MTEPETPMPTSEAPSSGKRRTPWWLPVIVILGALPAVFALLIFGFIVRYSVAHDPETCPYQPGESRVLRDGVSVREDSRSCLDDVDDHRWVVLRDGYDELALGNLPLMGDAEGFTWEARLEEDRVVVDVSIRDRGDLTFREPERDDD